MKIISHVPLLKISFTMVEEVERALKVVKIVGCSVGKEYKESNKYTTTPMAAISLTHSWLRVAVAITWRVLSWIAWNSVLFSKENSNWKYPMHNISKPEIIQKINLSGWKEKEMMIPIIYQGYLIWDYSKRVMPSLYVLSFRYRLLA